MRPDFSRSNAMTRFQAIMMAGAASLFLAGAAGSSMAAEQTGAENIAPIALNSLANPPDKIATARVVDDKGITVGAVQKVEMDQSGKPLQVEIALLGADRVIALPSSQLSYDQPNNVVTAAMDKAELARMPPG
jgi:hypothetical protein